MQDIHIEYSQPKFWHRVLANLTDLLILAFAFITCFLFVRMAVNNSADYEECLQTVETIRQDSGLYILTNDGYFAVDSYIDKYADLSSKQKMKAGEKAINTFITYLGEQSLNDVQEMVKKDYQAFVENLKDGDDIFYFIIVNGDVIKNESCSATDLQYYENAYKPFIVDYCFGYLTGYVPSYYAAIKKMSNAFFFIEFPVSLITSSCLVYLIPPIFFKKGRKTLGKALYHIGLVNPQCFNCSYQRYLARFSIFLAELILSIFSFGVPFIISFSLMAFSKKRQGFPDFMLGLTEIDNSKNKIYEDMVEVALDFDQEHKKPIDFKMKKGL